MSTFLSIVGICLCSVAALQLDLLSELSEPDDVFFKNVPKNWARPVFYIIVMGNLTKHHQVNTVVGSLRQLGGWMGPIVIVTDDSACIANKLARAGLIRPDTSDGDVAIYESVQHPGTVHIVKVPPTDQTILMKRQKALAWENVARAKIPNASHIVYLDEDIVVGRRLDEFMGDVLSWRYQRGALSAPTLALFRDRGFTHGEFSTSIVVMFPTEASRACLSSWGEALGQADGTGSVHLMRLAGPDQQALARIDQCTARLKIMDPKYLMLPTNERLKSGMTSTFVHFSNTGRWWTVPREYGRRWMKDVLHLSLALDMYGSTSCTQA